MALTFDDGLLFRVWDRERRCWAGDQRGDNIRDLEAYALDEFKDAHLVYCDMEGWAIADDGVLMIVDECGNHAYADNDRFEIRFDPKLLESYGLASAARWRARALAAEADPNDIRNAAGELARLVLGSRQKIGREIRDAADRVIHKIEKSERTEEPPSTNAEAEDQTTKGSTSK